MSQLGPSGSGEPNAKKRKENIENTADGDTVAIAPVEEQTADIFKMDIDCCEEAFDYLPLEDLVSVGKTCKRLQQVAGHCFQLNCSEDLVHISKEGIQFVEPFAPFIQKFLILDEHGLQYFSKCQSKLRRLKEVHIRSFETTDMDCLKKISMGKIETLYFHHCELSNNFHEIIDHCTKLSRLEIEDCSGELNWLNRKYPTLEHFGFVSFAENSIESIPAFLELNPNIRKFETYPEFLREHQDTMKNIKLDDLRIRMCRNLDTSEFVSTCDLLNKLYEQGFYKKLQINIQFLNQDLNQEKINRLASLNGLNKLWLFCGSNTYKLPAMNNLEELFVFIGYRIANIDNLPNDLINLRRIYFIIVSFDSIMPFIRRSVEMHTIRVERLEAGVHFNKNTGIIDLPALNRERALLTPKQLVAVQKITLYVREEIYLATKWAFGSTDFEHIRLKRNYSAWWNSPGIF